MVLQRADRTAPLLETSGRAGQARIRRDHGPGVSMPLGYDGKLYILAFDHRGSFQKKMFGIEGDPTPEQTATISDAKHLIYEGMVKALEKGDVHPDQLGVLVDLERVTDEQGPLRRDEL
jgi:hypothetical protein